MTTDSVLYRKQGALAEILLDRPRALNALSAEMIHALSVHFTQAFADDDIKTIWLGSTTEKALCAGGDVKALIQAIAPIDDHQQRFEIGRNYFQQEYELDWMIDNSPKPIVVFGQGVVFGGGWGLFAGANLRLADQSARFCMPEIQIGYFADVGAAAFLQKNNWKVGTLMAMSGITISAQEAMALNFVDDLVTSEYAEHLQTQLSKGIDISELDVLSSMDLSELIAQWSETMALLPDDAALSDWVNIIHKEQSPIFSRAAASMMTGSPHSIAFAWHYFRQWRCAEREQVLALESQIAARFCNQQDFIEGVSAKLIDKSNEPTWQHSQVESVSIEEIEPLLKRT